MPAGVYHALRPLAPVALAGMLAVGGLALLWWFLEPAAARLGLPPEERLDLVRVYLLAVGGALLIWQIAVANRRASSAERVAELTELGNITDRLNAAIANLGSDNSVVRIGALYQLHHIAIDAPDYRRTVFELVKAHYYLIAAQMDTALESDAKASVELVAVSRMMWQKIDDGGVYYGSESAENGR